MAKNPFQKVANSRRYNIGAIERPKNYDPLKDKGKYMNPEMLSYFWQQLRNTYEELGREIDALKGSALVFDVSAEPIERSQNHQAAKPDLIRMEQNTEQRQRIENTIDEIELNGPESEYGYCITSGEEISVRRLMSRPEARTTIEVQEAREKSAKVHAPHLRRSITG